MALMVEERKVQQIEEQILKELIKRPVKQVKVSFDYIDVSLLNEEHRNNEAECILAKW